VAGATNTTDFLDIMRIVGSVGGFAGFAALIWRVIDVFRSYLSLEASAEIERDIGVVRIKTCLENKGQKAKRLDAAFLCGNPL
jgi:hypothetical protein